MTRTALADAFNKLAEAAAVVAIELEADEQPGSGSVVPSAPAPVEPSIQEVHVTAALGVCPVHKVAWESRPAGVSKKTGKPYNAFWSCGQRDGDNYCKEKPVKAWTDSHPISIDEVPF